MSHDLVLAGGRVVDPETGFDRVCDVGIDGDSVTAVGDRLDGATTRRRRRARRRPWLRRPPQPRADAAGTAAPGVRRGHHRARPRSRPRAGGARVRERSEARFPDQLRLLGVMGGRAHARGRGRAARRGCRGDLRRVGRHRVATGRDRGASWRGSSTRSRPTSPPAPSASACSSATHPASIRPSISPSRSWRPPPACRRSRTRVTSSSWRRRR